MFKKKNSGYIIDQGSQTFIFNDPNLKYEICHNQNYNKIKNHIFAFYYFNL